MLFHLDPPYFGHEGDYRDSVFSADDFGRMAEVLASIKCTFLLSINDRLEIRENFSGFRLGEVFLTYSISGGKSRPAKELVIRP